MNIVSQQKSYAIFSIIILICLLAVGLNIQNELIQSSNRIGLDIEMLENKILITHVIEDGPSHRAGLTAPSYLVSINEKSIHDLAQLDAALSMTDNEITVVINKNGATSSHNIQKGIVPALREIFKDTLISALFLILAFISIPCQGCRNTLRNALLIVLFLFLGLEYTLLPLRSYININEGFSQWIVTSGVLLCAIVGGLTLALELHILCITPKPQPWFNKHKKIILTAFYSVSIYFIVTLAVSYFDARPYGIIGKLFSMTAWSLIDLIWVSLILLIIVKQYQGTESRRGKNLLIILLAGMLPFVISIFLLEWNFLTRSEEQSWLEAFETFASFTFSIGFMVVIKRYDLVDIERDIKRPFVFKMTSALIIFYLLNTLYDYYLSTEILNQSYIFYFGIVSLFCGMIWLPLAYLLQHWASNPWHSESSSSLPGLDNVLDSVLAYSSNHRVAENLPRLLNTTLNTNWVAVSLIRNGNQPYFFINQQTGANLNVGQIEAELISLFYGQLHNSYYLKQASDATTLFEMGATHVFPLTYREEVYGGIALAQNSSFELISTKSLNYFAQKLAEIVFTNKIRHLATIDGLTQVLRREAVLEKLYSEFVRYQRTDEEISICLLDLDHFKRVNDSYGHAAGDNVLKQTASLLKQKIRSTDFIGRYGGEEFLIIFPNTECDQAKTLLESLRQSIHNSPMNIDSHKNINIAASMGLASTRHLQTNDEKNPYQLIQKLIGEADIALYLAKEMGRNKVVISPGAVS